MASTITTLMPTLFTAANQVVQERVGVIDGVNMSFDSKGVAYGDNVDVPVFPSLAASNFTPGNALPAGTDHTAEKVSVTISKQRKVSTPLTGEQIRTLENGTNYQTWVTQFIKEGMRTLLNEAEIDACSALKVGASRAYGTAGTTPFASDLSALTNARKILVDNGAPMADLQLALNTDASLNFFNLSVNQNAYQAGENSLLVNGSVPKRFGFSIRESAGIATHTKGTAASATSDATGYAIGSTTIGTAAAGTGTIIAGDVITFAGDTTNKLVVKTGVADVSSASSLVLNKPGIRTAMSAAAKAITMTANYTPSFAFERSAVVGVVRPPIIPASAVINQVLIPTEKGFSILMLDIIEYGQRVWELHLCWGFKVINPQMVATILG